MGNAQHHEPAPQPDPAIEQLGAKEPDPASWEFVQAQIQLIHPGDTARLTVFLGQYPNFHDQIISAAQAHLGNATVQLALRAMSGEFHGHAPTDDARGMMEGAPPTGASTDDFRGKPPTDDVRGMVEGAPPVLANPDDFRGKAPTDDVRGMVEGAPAVLANPDGFRGHAPDPNAWSSVENSVNVAENADQLALILKAHPQYRQQIVDTATSRLGSDVVAKAIQIADAPAATAKEEPEKAPATEEAGPKPGDAPTQATAPQVEEEKKPAWVSRADAYNAEHFARTEEFNALTNFLCVSDGVIDPMLVARWQDQHGVPPDGRVGPHTLEAARAAAKQQAVARGQAPEEATEAAEAASKEVQ